LKPRLSWQLVALSVSNHVKMDNSNKKDQSMTQKKTKSTATQKTEKKKIPEVVKRVSQKSSQKKQVHRKQIKQN